jgi:hypothetical protein
MCSTTEVRRSKEEAFKMITLEDLGVTEEELAAIGGARQRVRLTNRVRWRAQTALTAAEEAYSLLRELGDAGDVLQAAENAIAAAGRLVDAVRDWPGGMR